MTRSTEKSCGPACAARERNWQRTMSHLNTVAKPCGRKVTAIVDEQEAIHSPDRA
jgi:hypothetical protein